MATVPARKPTQEQKELLQRIEAAHKNFKLLSELACPQNASEYTDIQAERQCDATDAVLGLIDLLEVARGLGMDNKEFPLVKKLMSVYNYIYEPKKVPESPTGSLFPET